MSLTNAPLSGPVSYSTSDSLIAQEFTITSVTDISGLSAWFDASQTGTITNITGAVTSWASVVNSHTLTQGTSAQRPITGTRTVNGLNGVDFNGTAHNLIGSSGLYTLPNSANTLVVVYQSDNTGDAQQRIVYGTNGTTGRYYFQIQTDQVNAVNNTASGAGGTTSLCTRNTSPHVGIGVFNGASQLGCQDNGNLSGNNLGASFTLTSLLVGAQTAGSNRFDGILCEILIYSKALTVVEMNQLGDLLARKWGLSEWGYVG